MPNKEKNIPKRRFKEFENADAWELRKLNNIADVRDGTHNSPQYIEFGYPLVTSKNIKNGQVNFEDIQYISSFDYEEINKRSKVNINDILMGMIGTVGNLALVREEPEFAIKNVALIKNIGVVNVEFLYHYLGSYVIEKQLLNSLDGGTQKFISLNKIRHLNITFPTHPEQEAIGTFFSTLDRHITLHQRKLDKLKSVKQAYLSEMFPAEGERVPKRRFPGFTDAWELRKLVNEVLFIGTGKSKFSALEFGEFEILGSTSVIGYDNSYDYEGDFILTARVGANAGELYRHSGKVKISDNTVFIQGDGLDFIFYILQHFDIKKLSFGTGQPLVKASELKELKILMPVSVKERNHVGTFFSTLDRHITLHQRKLEKLKNLKKALLNELFV
ncbi:restriction endonuclease subunit S [Streptococcus suis]|uniref:restriction endonuclease subunit S n=1 Tax=Streptococcus suis TaxID=1307 RepID=UPI00240D9E05|nr:restriction endonuclease subunit S [Streptococcus suis]WFA75845.1 restriction endonuclease subunit S [Streptococcus suis]